MEQGVFDKYSLLYPYISEYVNSLLDENNKDDVLYIFNRCFKDLSRTIKFDNDMRSFLILSRVLKMCLGEYNFSTKLLSLKEKEAFVSNKENLDNLAAIVTMKFIILRKSFEEKDIHDVSISSFYPVNTTLGSLMKVLLEFNGKFSQNDPNKSLIEDMFQRVFTKIAATSKMFYLSLASECYVSWRTLHEAECIIKLLCANGTCTQQTYIKHIAYNNALRGGIEDQEQLDVIFDQMKTEMKSHNLKSKDMKKYIEYGWLYDTVEYKENDPSYKLNFRDGVEKCAGLSQYNQWYEAASEVTHSSPIFFYSNNKFFLDLSIVSIYEVAVRVTTLYLVYFRRRLQENRKNLVLISTLKKSCDKVLNIIKKVFDITYDIEQENMTEEDIAFKKCFEI